MSTTTLTGEVLRTSANGNGATLNGKNMDRQVMSKEKEDKILKKIEGHCEKWSMIANAYVVCIIVFGVSAVSTSVLVSIYTGQETLIGVSTIKILACVSTISLAILTAFSLVDNSGNARNAWRSLNASLMLYSAGAISIEQLIEQYQKDESMMGNLSFNYGTASGKEGTYTQDIAASNIEKKQHEITEAQKVMDTANEAFTSATEDEKRITDQVSKLEAKLKEVPDEEKGKIQEELKELKSKQDDALEKLKQDSEAKTDAEKALEQKQKELSLAKNASN